MRSTADIHKLISTDKSQTGNDTQQNTFIVQDALNTHSDITNWRSMQMMTNESNGQNDLWLSTSGAPNKLGWQAIAKNIKQITNDNAKHMIVLDLRQESHAYLNDQGITLASRNNISEINLGKNSQQVLEAESLWLESLSQCSPLSVLTSKHLKQKDFKSETFITPQTIKNEKEMVKEQGFDYRRFAVTDHQAPCNEIIDQFIELYDELKDSDWLHIHCKGGKGRSTTFAAFYLMLKMADKISCDDIIAKLASVAPYYNLSDTGQELNRLEGRRNKYELLQKFHHFALDRIKGNKNTWSNWLAENSKIINPDMAFVTNEKDQQDSTNYLNPMCQRQ